VSPTGHAIDIQNISIQDCDSSNGIVTSMVGPDWAWIVPRLTYLIYVRRRGLVGNCIGIIKDILTYIVALVNVSRLIVVMTVPLIGRRYWTHGNRC